MAELLGLYYWDYIDYIDEGMEHHGAWEMYCTVIGMREAENE